MFIRKSKQVGKALLWGKKLTEVWISKALYLQPRGWVSVCKVTGGATLAQLQRILAAKQDCDNCKLFFTSAIEEYPSANQVTVSSFHYPARPIKNTNLKLQVPLLNCLPKLHIGFSEYAKDCSLIFRIESQTSSQAGPVVIRQFRFCCSCKACRSLFSGFSFFNCFQSTDQCGILICRLLLVARPPAVLPW